MKQSFWERAMRINVSAALAGAARRFRRNRDGVAIIEFAMIVPILVIMLIGTAEVSRAIAADRRFAQVTAMIADLVAREEEIKASDMTAIYAIVDQIMGAYGDGTLKVSLLPVMMDPKKPGTAKVYPKTGNRPGYQGGAVPAQCSPLVIDAKLAPAGGTVVIVDTSFTYKPLLTGYLLNTMEWSDRAVATPRHSCVDFDNDDCAPTTCFP
jgi:Flp pilus assembly protein TadG